MTGGFRRLRVDIADVGAKLFDVFFMGIRNDCTFVRRAFGTACSALHMDGIFRCGEGAIGFVFDIEIAEGDGRNSVVARAARDSKVFNGLELDVTQAFLERMGTKGAPADWSGIWAMTTK